MSKINTSGGPVNLSKAAVSHSSDTPSAPTVRDAYSTK